MFTKFEVQDTFPVCIADYGERCKRWRDSFYIALPLGMMINEFIAAAIYSETVTACLENFISFTFYVCTTRGIIGWFVNHLSPKLILLAEINQLRKPLSDSLKVNYYSEIVWHAMLNTYFHCHEIISWVNK